MRFNNRVCHRLHDEHVATIALAGQLEQLIARYPQDAPDIDDSGSEQFLSNLSTDIGGEVERHFAFEESELFTYLETIGEMAIGALLTEEHKVLRPLGMQLAALARNARDRRLKPAEWRALSHAGQE